MGALIDRLSQAACRLVWIEYASYAGALLSKGVVPWLDVAEFVAWQRKAQGLLKSDVVSLPVAKICAAWLQVQPALRATMGAKQRAVFPLKTLLADEGLRAHLVELTRGLRASQSGSPLVLVMPSPRQWVAEAYAQAFIGAVIESGNDEADSAAVYMADFLRAFGDCGVDGLLLEESPGYVPATDEDIACYQAVLNVAAYYRWDAGLLLSNTTGMTATAGLAFVIAPQAQPTVCSGIVLAPDFWSGVAAPAIPDGAFRYAQIPVEAKPESVLDRLASLH